MRDFSGAYAVEAVELRKGKGGMRFNNKRFKQQITKQQVTIVGSCSHPAWSFDQAVKEI